MKTKITLCLALCTLAFLSTFFSCRKSDITAGKQSVSSPAFKSHTLSINQNLIAYWPLDGSGADLSGNGHTGTLSGVSATADRFGNTSGACSFNGTSSYISVPDNSALRLSSTDFTVNAWIKLRTYNSSYGSAILGKHTTGTNDGWSWSVTGSASPTKGVEFFGPGGGSTNAYGTKVIDTNWHMITAIYINSASQLKFYVDGVLDNTTGSISSPSSAITQALYMGRDSYTSAYYFDGAMDEVRMYSTALDTASIHGLYNEPNPNSLIAYWSFDGNANDFSGNGNNGTVNNVFSYPDRFGNAKSAYHFNGTSSYITVPDNAALRLNNTDFTLNAWIKADSYNASYGSAILSKHTSGLNDGWSWSLTGSLSSPVGVLFFGPGGEAQMPPAPMW